MEERKCDCGCKNFYSYQVQNNVTYICKHCWKEWLGPNYTIQCEDEHVHHFNRGFPVSPFIEPVKMDHLKLDWEEGTNTSSLSAGDHIMWHRAYVVWHHAILLENKHDTAWEIMHFSPRGCCSCCTVHSIALDLARSIGTLYRAKYTNNIQARNPPLLVCARAAALEGSKDYDFFHKNCENFARFCKTGFSYNHQYPWLMVKLNETATSAFLGSAKAIKVLLVLKKIMFAETVEFSLNMDQELIGASIVFFLEMVSLITDVGSMYYEKKHPRCGISLDAGDINLLIFMRVFEVLFGLLGIIGGEILFEKMCFLVGKAECPGVGAVAGFASGIMAFGVFGGFIFGVLAKAFGTTVGRFLGGKCLCCKGSTQTVPTEQQQPPAEQDDDDHSVQEAATERKTRRYEPSSWEAQLGIVLIFWSIVLNYDFGGEYRDTYKNFRGSIQATCIVDNTTYYSHSYPCAAIKVHIDSQNQSTGINQYSVWLFENEHTLQHHNCSYHPVCATNNTYTSRAVEIYVDEFGIPGSNFTCYYYKANNQSLMIIRNRTPVAIFIHMFFWPNLCLFIGICLFTHAIVRRRKELRQNCVDQNCFVTVLIIMGMWSYFDLYKSWRENKLLLGKPVRYQDYRVLLDSPRYLYHKIPVQTQCQAI